MAQQHSPGDFKVENLYDVKGWVAVVTGGATGLGLMATLALVENGARVYITGRRMEVLEQAASKYPDSIVPYQCDVTDKDSIIKLAEFVASKEKYVNLLINNAGIGGVKNAFAADPTTPESVSQALLHGPGATIKEWQDVLLLNTTAIYFGTAAFIPLLMAAKEQFGSPGSVINVSSMSGMTKQSQGGQFAYNTAKAAAISLTQQLAFELRRPELEIRVNTIAPGYFPSEMTRPEKYPTNPHEMRKLKGIPMGRLGAPKEYAQAILQLAVNTYVTGDVLLIDGGWLLEQS